MHQAGSLEIATLAAAIARTPLRQIGCRSSRGPRGPPAATMVRRQRLFTEAANHPDIQSVFGQKARGPPHNRSSVWRHRPTPEPALSPDRCPARWLDASGRVSSAETSSCGNRPFRRKRRAVRQRQRGVFVDKAGQAFSPQRHRLSSPNRASPTNPTRSECRRAPAQSPISRCGAGSARDIVPSPQLRPPAHAVADRKPLAAGPRRWRTGPRAYNRPAARITAVAGDRSAGRQRCLRTRTTVWPRHEIPDHI